MPPTLIFVFLFFIQSPLPQFLFGLMPPRLFIIPNIFYTPAAKLTISIQTFQHQKFQSLNMRKTCKKHVKKDPYIGSTVYYRNILLVFC